MSATSHYSFELGGDKKTKGAALTFVRRSLYFLMLKLLTSASSTSDQHDVVFFLSIIPSPVLLYTWLFTLSMSMSPSCIDISHAAYTYMNAKQIQKVLLVRLY